MATGTRVGFDSLSASAASFWSTPDWSARLEQAVDRAAEHLLGLQVEGTYWAGELEADTTLESDYIYYLICFGKADPDRIAKLANYVRQLQLADGGWSIYPGGPSELNATCKAYFALKLAGDDPSSSAIERRSRDDSPSRRPGSHQFLRSLLSGAGRRALAGNLFRPFLRS